MVGKRRGIGVYPSHPVLGRTQGTIITSTFLFCICQGHLSELLFTVNRLKLSFIIRAFSDKERTHCVWKHGDSQGFQHASLISSKQLRRKEVLHIVFKWGLISFLKVSWHIKGFIWDSQPDCVTLTILLVMRFGSSPVQWYIPFHLCASNI